MRKKLLLLSGSFGLAFATLALPSLAGVITGSCQSITVTPNSSSLLDFACTEQNAAPVAVDDSASGLSLSDIAGNVLTNDTDADNDTLSVVQPNADIAADGSFLLNYPTPGIRTIPYQVTDGTDTDSGLLSIDVLNRDPVLVADTNSGLSGSDLSGNVLANDSDPDGGTLSVVQPNEHIAADGSYLITQSTPGEVVIPYEVTDGQGGQEASQLTLLFENQPPIASDDTATTQVNIAASGNALANDTDPDDGVLSVTSSNGDFTVAANGAWTFTSSIAGTFSAGYTVSDGQGGFDTASITVTVEPPANQPPVANDDSNSGIVSTAITGNVLANDTDPESQTLSVVPPSASIINADGSYSFTEATPGTYSFDYTVSDGNGGTDTGTLTITVTQEQTQGILAFPGADGFGRFAQGGRGGTVCQVTNLNDSGPGSFRSCVEASGPRTVVFRVSGYIACGPTSMELQNPYITIAGETAPGQGVALKNCPERTSPVIRVNTHDVIIRHMRFRAGNPPHNAAGSPNGDSFAIGQLQQSLGPVYNIAISNSSFSWGTDENFDISPLTGNNALPSEVERVTLQDSLIYEGLRSHSKGPNLRSCGISIVRSLIASNTIRNPNNTCGKWNVGGTRSGGGITGENEFRNNVVYNGGEAFFDMWDGRGEGWANVVGNVFIKGPNSLKKLPSVAWDVYPVDVWTFSDRNLNSGSCAQNNGVNCTSEADPMHIHVAGNLAINSGSKVFPSNGIDGVLNPNDAHVYSATPVGDGYGEDGLTGPVMPASQVEAWIQENAGAFPNNRDAADENILQELATRTGAIPQCTTSSTTTTCDLAPAMPTLASGTPYADSDGDGMSDSYESTTGRTDPNADHDGDGWTNLEEFLHELAASR